jgi:hypothetical protein
MTVERANQKCSHLPNRQEARLNGLGITGLLHAAAFVEFYAPDRLMIIALAVAP